MSTAKVDPVTRAAIDWMLRLESGQAPLEESISLYEQGAALKAHCEARLKDAQLRVEKIVVGPDGQAKGAEPAEFG